MFTSHAPLGLDLLLTLLAFVLLSMAALKVPESRVSWGWCGLALLALSALL